MVRGDGATYYRVRLTVPRKGGSRAWGAVSGALDRELGGQENLTVIGPHIDSEVRRGRDYVRVVIVMTVVAADVAEALDKAWQAFRQAAGDDLAGWDTAAASAAVKPE